MNAYEALDKIEEIFNRISLEEDEYEIVEKCEQVLYEFIRKHAPENKSYPETFKCSCGETIHRYDIYGGYARFFCHFCDAEWLIGPEEE